MIKLTRSEAKSYVILHAEMIRKRLNEQSSLTVPRYSVKKLAQALSVGQQMAFMMDNKQTLLVVSYHPIFDFGERLKRVLFVELVVSFSDYKGVIPRNMHNLMKMTDISGAENIVFRTAKPSLARVMSRYGFEFYIEHINGAKYYAASVKDIESTIGKVA